MSDDEGATLRLVAQLHDRISVMETQLERLVMFVDTVVDGMAAARSAPGIQGMMAKNMLPDMSGYQPPPIPDGFVLPQKESTAP
jgi:hypothetical protein